MRIGNEKEHVDIVYIMDVKSKSDLLDEIGKFLSLGYEMIGENEIDYGNDTKYSARMMKILRGD